MAPVAGPVLNVVDVFSGAGGFSCGLGMAGMRCVLGIERDAAACGTFALNHPGAAVHQDDVERLRRPVLEGLLGRRRVHVVVGGPPCQGFSTVGTGDPADRRNGLFRGFVRVVRATAPEFVIVENVTGLLARKNEGTLRAILRALEREGFHLDVRVMEAQRHGVPERRRRTIIMGTRLPVPVEFPPEDGGPPPTVGDALGDLRDAGGGVHNHDLKAAARMPGIDRRRLARVPEGRGVRYERDEAELLPPSLRLGLDWARVPEGRLRQIRYQRLDRSLPSPTIATQRQMYYHPVEPRFLTAREAARLQSFPNGFVFRGSETSQWRQIGNAVPPLLARALGEAVKRMRRRAMRRRAMRRSAAAAGDGRPHSKPPPRFPAASRIGSLRGRAFVYRDNKPGSAPGAGSGVGSGSRPG